MKALTVSARQDLAGSCDQVLTRYLDRVAFASDASFYRQIPLAIARPRTLAEVAALFKWSHQFEIPLVFRAAGTSLSGQAITNGLLVDLSLHWRGFSVDTDPSENHVVSAQPGVIGGHLNLYLQSLGQKIGPDPASIQSCMIGGIVANNASGMCCGVSQNAYHTLDSLVFMLPDGKSYDSAQALHRERFTLEQHALCATLLAIRDEILKNPTLLAKIRQKYRQKNTVGYSLNAFVDYHEPIDIFSHLLVGSEGTLAFIAEARLKTQPVQPFSGTGLLCFRSLKDACEAVSSLLPICQAIELMDAASLKCLSSESLGPWFPLTALKNMSEEPCALLVECQAATAEGLALQLRELAARSNSFALLQAPNMTQIPEEQAMLWKLRKGLYPSVGAVRASGTAVIIEDVVFPAESLATGIQGLQRLFKKYDCEGIIFGHARDGNVHFVITQAFHTPEDIVRYDGFMQDIVELVLTLKGALKAEHGTGRNMAPFVAAEWGKDALALMQRLKQAVDPLLLLNPGVILNKDPEAHLKDLKNLPKIDSEVDRCTECGFCESVCPSRRLTLTPRQRIVLRRERERLLETKQLAQLKELDADYHYAGLETCATDSLCASSCPIGIDTGALVKRLRSEAIPSFVQQQVGALSTGFAQAETGIKLALSAAHLGNSLFQKPLNFALKTAGGLLNTPLPMWDSRLPQANFKALPQTHAEGATFVYFPSCLSRNLGYKNETDLPNLVLELAKRAGHHLHIPAHTQGNCCGLPFGSKGFKTAQEKTFQRTFDMLWAASHHGLLPVIMDTSPCTYHLQEQLKTQGHKQGLEILDFVDFCDRYLLPVLSLQPVFERLYVHPVCSVQKMDLTAALMRIAKRCAQSVIAPAVPTCCGTAGDRGLLYPELTTAALSDVKAELQAQPVNVLCSSSRSCEMGLSIELDAPVVSLAHIVFAAHTATNAPTEEAF